MSQPSSSAGSGVRIQKLLAQAGLASRRQAEEWIREGRVQVNGRTVALGDRADPERDAIKVDGRRVKGASSEKTYLLLNKPKGFVTTVADPESRDTVMDLVPDRLRAAVKPVGRLDVQTEGLLILTDDGDLARDVTHPSNGCAKEYEVKVSGIPAERDVERLRRGIFLDGRRTRSCEIDRLRTTAGRNEGNAWFRVILREGRTRQIRRMFETIGHSVSKLKRVAIGPIRDPGLPVGTTRRLSREEVEALRRSLAASAAVPAATAPPAASRPASGLLRRPPRLSPPSPSSPPSSSRARPSPRSSRPPALPGPRPVPAGPRRSRPGPAPATVKRPAPDRGSRSPSDRSSRPVPDRAPRSSPDRHSRPSPDRPPRRPDRPGKRR